MKAVDLLGAAAPAAKSAVKAVDKASEPGKMQRLQAMEMLKKEVLPAAVGGVAGYMLWRKHKWLGLLAGSALGASAVPLWKGENRLKYGLALASVGLGVGASLKYRKHPAVAYVAGAVVGGLVSNQVLKRA